MTISIGTLKPGDIVYDVRRQKMGNTTMSRLACWAVHIKEVDPETGRVLASWNGNAPRAFYARSGKMPWRRTEPKEPRR